MEPSRSCLSFSDLLVSLALGALGVHTKLDLFHVLRLATRCTLNRGGNVRLTVRSLVGLRHYFSPTT